MGLVSVQAVLERVKRAAQPPEMGICCHLPICKLPPNDIYLLDYLCLLLPIPKLRTNVKDVIFGITSVHVISIVGADKKGGWSRLGIKSEVRDLTWFS
jgi:hypothetical protein